MSELHVDTTRVAGRSTIRLAGELDVGTVSLLREAALGELASGDCSSLVIGLAEVSFVDSTGLGALVELNNRAEQAGIRFALGSPRRSVARILEMSGLDSLFAIAD